MNKKTIITILLALVAVAGQAQVHYRLEGNIGMPEFTGVMEVKDVLKQQPVDTIKVVNGVITPKEGDLPEMALCVLSDTTKNIVLIDSIPCRISALTLAFLYIDNGITMIEGLKDNWLQQSGTAISVEITAVNQRMEEIQETYGNGDEGKKVLADFLYEIISKHTSDVYGIELLSNEGRWYLKPTQWLELYEKIMADNGEYISRTPYLADNLKRTNEKLKRLVSVQPTDVGCKFVDFAVEYDGKTTHLSDYVGRGKYVLVDFWASWCGPCREEIPNIIEAYYKYKDCGLQVIGIAVSDKPEATLKAIKDDGVPYPQIINSQEIATDIYNISGIPHIILFAPDGTILARGLRGEELEKKLEEIFPITN